MKLGKQIADYVQYQPTLKCAANFVLFIYLYIKRVSPELSCIQDIFGFKPAIDIFSKISVTVRVFHYIIVFPFFHFHFYCTIQNTIVSGHQ